jgi:hypothetical protein
LQGRWVSGGRWAKATPAMYGPALRATQSKTKLWWGWGPSPPNTLSSRWGTVSPFPHRNACQPGGSADLMGGADGACTDKLDMWHSALTALTLPNFHTTAFHSTLTALTLPNLHATAFSSPLPRRPLPLLNRCVHDKRNSKTNVSPHHRHQPSTAYHNYLALHPHTADHKEARANSKSKAPLAQSENTQSPNTNQSSSTTFVKSKRVAPSEHLQVVCHEAMNKFKHRVLPRP